VERTAQEKVVSHFRRGAARVEVLGSDRTLFASDMLHDPEKGSAYIRWTIEVKDSLDIDPAERMAIYEGNARSLFKLG
jgi:predicted TIM-barrel fold metal-dependent hydrolase